MKKWILEQLIGVIIVLGFFSWIFSVIAMVETLTFTLPYVIWCVISILVIVIGILTYVYVSDEFDDPWLDQFRK